MSRLGQVRQRPHARTVGSERQHTAFPQEFHAVRVRVWITRRLAIQHVRDETTAFRQRLVILVRIVAAEQHHIAKSDRPMLFLESFDMFRLHQWADAIGRLVQQVADVHHARLATELPRLDLVRVRQTQRSRLFPFQFRSRHRMRRNVQLRARIAVDQQRVDVVRRLGPNRPRAYQRESWKRMARPSTRIIGRDQQRMIMESRRFSRLANHPAERNRENREHPQDPREWNSPPAASDCFHRSEPLWIVISG